ncbi:MAG: hypothetical protein NT157_00165 [Candidatus Micrarchaeota archaeon]|nr:hypothetical protein [Candidatus Micrarchaeota archaeon]
MEYDIGEMVREAVELSKKKKIEIDEALLSVMKNKSGNLQGQIIYNLFTSMVLRYPVSPKISIPVFANAEGIVAKAEYGREGLTCRLETKGEPDEELLRRKLEALVAPIIQEMKGKKFFCASCGFRSAKPIQDCPECGRKITDPRGFLEKVFGE